MNWIDKNIENRNRSLNLTININVHRSSEFWNTLTKSLTENRPFILFTNGWNIDFVIPEQKVIISFKWSTSVQSYIEQSTVISQTEQDWHNNIKLAIFSKEKISTNAAHAFMEARINQNAFTVFGKDSAGIFQSVRRLLDES